MSDIVHSFVEEAKHDGFCKFWTGRSVEGAEGYMGHTLMTYLNERDIKIATKLFP